MSNFYDLLRYAFTLVLMLCFSLSIQAQSLIKGVVTSGADGETLPGVNVLIKGTSTGTVTSIDGSFALQAAPEDILDVSFVGFKSQQIKVGAQTNIKVVLKNDVTALKEVVVIGYGTAKKSDLTGAVTAINASDFNQGAIASPQELLNGKVSGVRITTDGGAPGAGASIRIRGGSSLSASNSPLIIVDGLPLDSKGVSGMPNGLSSINPNDIETFTVLKDASATAIYGSRASNGVIIITTKKGGNDFQLSYTGNVSVATPASRITNLNSFEYENLINERFGADSAPGRLMGYNNALYDTDWQDMIFRNAISTEHNISVGGKVMKVLPYRASVGYNDNQGILKGSGMQRTTASLNLSPKFFDDHLSVNVNSKFMHMKNEFADQSAIGSAVAFDPTKPVFMDNQKYGGYYTWLDQSGSKIMQAPANPLAILNQQTIGSNVNRFIGNIQLDYKFHAIPNLKANLNLGLDQSVGNGEANTHAGSGINNEIYDRQGKFYNYRQDKKNELLDFYLQYNKDLPALKSRFDVMTGYSWQHFWYSESNHTSFGDGNENGKTDIEVRSENYLVSFFGRANYSFMERLNLTATLRYDGSSRFSENNRWGVFPSFAGAYNFKKEAFLKNSEVVSTLKLRVGWGLTGQQDVGNDYPSQGIYKFSNEPASFVYYRQDGSMVHVPTVRPEAYDETLKWESTATTNIGIDFGFKDDRINGSLELYERKTNDLLNTIPVPAGSNFRNHVLTNVGSLSNKGIELTLNGKVVQTSAFNWNLAFNASRNWSKITKLTAVDNPDYRGVLTGSIGGGTGNNVQIHAVNHSAFSYFLYQQVYDHEGKPVEGQYVDRNGDGIVNDDDRYIMDKNAIPDWTLGLSSNMTYKNWDMSMSFRANIGVYNYNASASGSGTFNEIITGGDYINNVHSDVLNTHFSKYNQLSDYYVQRADFLRLDNIMLGYNFKNITKSHMSARVYASVNNLFVLTPYKGMDPEVFNGIDSDFYPRPRTFLMGVNLTF
ncbi:TonB-dependent receptor [Persicobacter psychrovividus]|uniref:SusC/RagA family TonB-linked outer membrane protein n=1 Tax=Persicobacter psychrovividus TaxID=387638 RepID=A0ABN6LBK7_9BACT|nr:SusC/RagA family TonB-linked outer membrane protein [Persicobacter psychrovividus]